MTSRVAVHCQGGPRFPPPPQREAKFCSRRGWRQGPWPGPPLPRPATQRAARRPPTGAIRALRPRRRDGRRCPSPRPCPSPPRRPLLQEPGWPASAPARRREEAGSPLGVPRTRVGRRPRGAAQASPPHTYTHPTSSLRPSLAPGKFVKSSPAASSAGRRSAGRSRRRPGRQASASPRALPGLPAAARPVLQGPERGAADAGGAEGGSRPAPSARPSLHLRGAPDGRAAARGPPAGSARGAGRPRRGAGPSRGPARRWLRVRARPGRLHAAAPAPHERTPNHFQVPPRAAPSPSTRREGAGPAATRPPS